MSAFAPLSHRRMNRLREDIYADSKTAAIHSSRISAAAPRIFPARGLAKTASCWKTIRSSRSHRSATTSCSGAATTSAITTVIHDHVFVTSHVVVLRALHDRAALLSRRERHDQRSGDAGRRHARRNGGDHRAEHRAVDDLQGGRHASCRKFPAPTSTSNFGIRA